MKYIIGIDQSTQGTKAVLFDDLGEICGRADRSHHQLVNELGWVSHDLLEIYENLKIVVKTVIEENEIDQKDIVAIGLSNQRESTAAFYRDGSPAMESVVWQCARAEAIAKSKEEFAQMIKERTGLPLSPYFPASKMQWLKQAVEEKQQKEMNIENKQELLFGTMDTWLIYQLTEHKSYKTDYSNASRTQLFNLNTLCWDEEICELFQIPTSSLAKVCDSNSCFGHTTLEGYFEKDIPIHAVVGDSHAALFGQGCHHRGMVKTTYGTGSSIMMHVGNHFIKSNQGLATSLAWSIDGEIEFVLEGNINYTGAVITWLKDEMELITNTSETQELAEMANPKDETIVIPAFSGLGAPYWRGEAKAMIFGMSRLTGKKEIVKASLESIGFQIVDILTAMEADSGKKIKELRVDGGPSRNHFLMQFQSDLANTLVSVARDEELSAIGAAYMAGTAVGIYDKCIFDRMSYKSYEPKMEEEERKIKCKRWKEAIEKVLI